jgi:hypothetical protein
MRLAMSHDAKDDGRSPFSSILLVIVTSLFGITAIPKMLSSDRPKNIEAAKKPEKNEEGNQQDPRYPTRARLWEDPLKEIERLDSLVKDSDQGKPDSKLQMASRLLPGYQIRLLKALSNQSPPASLAARILPKEAVQKKTRILIALAQDGNDEESIELRRRERVVQIAALGTAGYYPVEEDWICHFKMKQSYGSQNETKWVPIPYEWFERKGDRCLLIWYRFQEKSDQLLFDINNLLENMLSSFPEARSKLDSPVSDVMLGGRIGTTPATRIRNGCLPDVFNKLKYLKFFAENDNFNVVATISTVEELRDSLVKDADAKARGYNLSASKVKMVFPSGTDRHLARLLRQELDARDLGNWGLGRHIQIAILTDLDSNYGRRLVSTYRAEFKATRDFNLDPRPENKYNITPYAYFRGIDGIAAFSDKQSISPQTTANKPSASNAQGNAQYDYMNRLVDSMKQSGIDYRAIGILGSDAYDKVLLLKALRPAYPDAVFFTTDMDARLLQPGDLTYTKNLLIASHFGLELETGLQATVPPFRSCYNTASYLGSLWLLLNKLPAENLTEDAKLRLDRINNELELVLSHAKNGENAERLARIYEVGRSTPYELTTTVSDDRDVRPMPNRTLVRFHFFDWLAIVIFGVCVSLLIFCFSHGISKFLGIGWVMIVICLFPFAFMIAMMLYSHYQLFGEPAVLFEGISVWPTNLLRLLAIVVSFYFLYSIYKQLKKRRGILLRYFTSAQILPKVYEDAEHEKKSDESFLRHYTRHWMSIACLDSFRFYRRFPTESDSKLAVLSLLHKGLRLGSWHRRLFRTVILFAINLILFLCLVTIFGYPSTPARGGIAKGVSYFMFFLSETVGLLFLVLFVVDTTILTFRFIKMLNVESNNLVWPANLVDPIASTGKLPKGVNRDCAEKADRIRLRIQLIKDCSLEVSEFIRYPFVVFLILVVAHAPLFDNWRWSTTQFIMAFLTIGTSLYCAYALRQQISKAISKAQQELREIELPPPLPAKMPRPVALNEETRGYIRLIRSDINATDGKMFHFFNNPLVYAVVYPLLGFGPEVAELVRSLVTSL